MEHTILMKLLREVVKDRRVLRLIRGRLTALDDGRRQCALRNQRDRSQGGVISALLSKIYLTPFDRALQAAGYAHVRYVRLLC